MKTTKTVRVVIAAALPLGAAIVALGGLVWSRARRGRSEHTDPYADWLSLRPRRQEPMSSGNGPVRTPESFPL
jgi:hypothetical protein